MLIFHFYVAMMSCLLVLKFAFQLVCYRVCDGQPSIMYCWQFA